MSTRRNFIKKTAIAGTAIAMAPNIAFGLSNKDHKLNVGIIGVGLRGTNHLDNLLKKRGC